MDGARRSRFESALRAMAEDPYGHGSTPINKEEDRREATVADVVVRYYVSESVLTLTVVRLVYL
ncbi:hypothetical protein ACIHFE_19730 [Streptomyces sp. NPDC052396]|uniref:hypothetical protein n=1 Tax=Streptomyces sp. NPDC052396 TaxID=3365689 RepID=UPI0037D482FF